MVNHHDCEVKWYKSQLSKLQDLLTRANVVLDKIPHESDKEQKETEQQNHKLKQELADVSKN